MNGEEFAKRHLNQILINNSTKFLWKFPDRAQHNTGRVVGYVKDPEELVLIEPSDPTLGWNPDNESRAILLEHSDRVWAVPVDDLYAVQVTPIVPKPRPKLTVDELNKVLGGLADELNKHTNTVPVLPPAQSPTKVIPEWPDTCPHCGCPAVMLAFSMKCSNASCPSTKR